MKQNEMVSHHICPAWLSFMLDARLRRLVHKPEKIIGEYLHPGDTAIDIGCGSGYFTLPMAKIVGEHGRIIATGSHDELTQSNPLYARLAALQFGAGFVSPSNDDVAPGGPAALQ